MKAQISILITFIVIFSSCEKTTYETEYIEGSTIIIDGENYFGDGADSTIIGIVNSVNHSYSIEEYNSGNNSELVTSIFYPNASVQWKYAEVIYSLQVPSLEEGDIIYVSGETQVTGSFSGHNILLAGKIILGNGSNDLPDSGNVIEVSEHNAYNYTPDMGHAVASHSGGYKCQTNLGDKYVNFCLRAEVFPSHPSGTLTVNQDFGRLTVLVFRKE